MEKWIVWIAVMAAIIATSTASASLRKSREIERRMNLDNIVDIVKIKNILLENINKYVKLELFEEVYLLNYQKALLLDVDDEWILLQNNKNKKVLIRLDNVKSIIVEENKK